MNLQTDTKHFTQVGPALDAGILQVFGWIPEEELTEEWTHRYGYPGRLYYSAPAGRVQDVRLCLRDLQHASTLTS